MPKTRQSPVLGPISQFRSSEEHETPQSLLDVETRLTNLENALQQLAGILQDISGQLGTLRQPKAPSKQKQHTLAKQAASQQYEAESCVVFLEYLADGKKATLADIHEETGISKNMCQRLRCKLRKAGVLGVEWSMGGNKSFRFFLKAEQDGNPTEDAG